MNIFFGLKKYFFLSMAVFAGAFFLGITTAKLRPDLAQLIFQAISEKFAPLREESAGNIFAYIFINNTLIDFLAIITFFLFGLGAVYILLSNGFIIGIVFQSSISEKGIPLLVAALTPHGIIELPSFFLSAGTGIWLGLKLFQKIFKNEPFKVHFVRAIKIFFFVIIPLNLIAAFIETYITPLIVTFF